MIYNIYTEHIKHEYTMERIGQSVVDTDRNRKATAKPIFTNLFQGMTTNKHEHITCIFIYILYAIFL